MSKAVKILWIIGVIFVVIGVIMAASDGLLTFSYIEYKDDLRGTNPDFEHMGEEELEERYEDYLVSMERTGISFYIFFFALGMGLILTAFGLFFMNVFGKKIKTQQEFAEYKQYRGYDTDTKLYEKQALSKIDLNAINEISERLSQVAPRLDSKSMSELKEVIDVFIKKHI